MPPSDWRSRNKRGLRFNPHSTSLLPSVQITSCTFTRGSGALTVHLLLLHSPRDPLRVFPPPLSLGSHWGASATGFASSSSSVEFSVFN